jgi:hypothetical protein
MDDLATGVTDIPTFATLVNRRILIPSERTHYIAVDRHFLFACMRPRIERIHVDEGWYERTYPDVARAVSDGVVPRTRDHYYRFGYFENRMPHPISVDEDYYLENSPDVAEAIRNGVFSSAQEHFDLAGFREGRLPYPGFSLFAETALSAPDAPLSTPGS